VGNADQVSFPNIDELKAQLKSVRSADSADDWYVSVTIYIYIYIYILNNILKYEKLLFYFGFPIN